MLFFLVRLYLIEGQVNDDGVSCFMFNYINIKRDIVSIKFTTLYFTSRFKE